MHRSNELEDKVVLVTGGSRGIGREIVMEALQAGARVAFCARRLGMQVESNETIEEGRILGLTADVSDEANVDWLFERILEQFGRIDVVINNAAISRDFLLVNLPVAVWDEVMAINLTGAFLIARRALREFLATGHCGTLISIGSVAQYGAPSNGSYAASKGGLLGLTQTIAQQYGDQGIRANLVVVGYVDGGLSKDLSASMKQRLADWCPQKRPATPKEIAAVVLFLSSSGAAALNGQALAATGGSIDIVL